MSNLFVYVLVSIHTMYTAGTPLHVPGYKHIVNAQEHMVKEYQSTFSTADKCHAVMREMNAATVGNSWYCEKHIVE